MKRISLYSFIALFAVLSSCDYVKFPDQNGSSGGPTGGPGLKKKILLEDFTGHQCGTCPPAHVEAASLAGQYPDQLVVMVHHAGFFAELGGSPYTYDFRTTEATAWFTDFGIGVTPKGMINRCNFSTGGHIYAYGAWATVVDTLRTKPLEAYITIDPTYTSSTRDLSLSIKTKFFSNLTGLHKIVVCLVEDSIVKPQKDYNSNPQDILNYTHRHVFRQTINGAYGDTLFTVSQSDGDSIMSTFNYNLPLQFAGLNCDENKCHIIAYVYDADPASPRYREIIQVEEVRITD
jgi:hypothetical protein